MLLQLHKSYVGTRPKKLLKLKIVELQLNELISTSLFGTPKPMSAAIIVE